MTLVCLSAINETCPNLKQLKIVGGSGRYDVLLVTPLLLSSPPSCSFNSSGSPSIPLRRLDRKAVKALPFLRFLLGERYPETKLWGFLSGLVDSSNLRFLKTSTELSADGGWCEFVYLMSRSAADSNVAEASAATRNAFRIVETKLAFTEA